MRHFAVLASALAAFAPSFALEVPLAKSFFNTDSTISDGTLNDVVQWAERAGNMDASHECSRERTMLPQLALGFYLGKLMIGTALSARYASLPSDILSPFHKESLHKLQLQSASEGYGRLNSSELDRIEMKWFGELDNGRKDNITHALSLAYHDVSALNLLCGEESTCNREWIKTKLPWGWYIRLAMLHKPINGTITICPRYFSREIHHKLVLAMTFPDLGLEDAELLSYTQAVLEVLLQRTTWSHIRAQGLMKCPEFGDAAFVPGCREREDMMDFGIKPCLLEKSADYVHYLLDIFVGAYCGPDNIRAPPIDDKSLRRFQDSLRISHSEDRIDALIEEIAKRMEADVRDAREGSSQDQSGPARRSELREGELEC